MTRLILVFACVTSPLAWADESPARLLQKVGDQKIVSLSGTSREMGVSHGRALKADIQVNIAKLVHGYALEEQGYTLEDLDKIASAQMEGWPESLKEELAGLAEGSGLPLVDLKRLQVIGRVLPTRSGAAFGARTLGSRLLHTYSVEPGRDLEARSVIAVFHPAAGIPYAGTTFAGFLGLLSGMNTEGISISAIQVPNGNSHSAGMSGPILARQVLAQTKTLPAAVTNIDQSKRAGSWTFIVGDGKIPAARAVESTPSKTAVFGPNDTAERLNPFKGLTEVVRRSNQFISKNLVAHDGAKPLLLPESMTRYQQLTELFDQPGRRLGTIEAVHLSREATASHHPTQLVIMNGSEQKIWVAFDGKSEKGAAGEVFQGYSLADLLTGEGLQSRVLIDTVDAPIDPQTERVAKGIVRPKKRTDERSIPEIYRLDDKPFEYEMSPDNVGSGIVRTMVKIPSPVETEYVENNTIPVEYFRPRGDGPFPCVIVTHIAGGDFELSRFVASTLANAGIACTFIKLPYYGERKPAGRRDVKMLAPDAGFASSAMGQAIQDIRRVCDWIEAQPQHDGRIGLCGISLGSITGALATAIEPRISHSTLIIGGGNLHDIVFESVEGEAREYRKLWESRGGTRESLAEIMAPYDPITYADRLKKRVVFMINAEQDESVPAKCGSALWEAAGKQRIVWYPCGHYTIVRYIMPALQLTVKFFKDWPEQSENVSTASK